jgi:hypothetical protein
LEKLLAGLEAMVPRVVVMVGRFFSEKAIETEPYAKLR